jgi:hypothetical protein
MFVLELRLVNGGYQSVLSIALDVKRLKEFNVFSIHGTLSYQMITFHVSSP